MNIYFRLNSVMFLISNYQLKLAKIPIYKILYYHETNIK